MKERSGIGFDIHPKDSQRRLMLGGVEILHEGLSGHSDGDVLCHAICDAILGACDLGDMGESFPETDNRWKDASSLTLLRETAATVRRLGWLVGHIDATVIAKEPELRSYRKQITEMLTEALSGVYVNVKFKSGNSVGDVGSGQAISALAIADVVKVFAK